MIVLKSKLARVFGSSTTIWYLLAGGLILRILLVLSINPTGDDTVDGYDYHNIALMLLRGEGYPAHGSLPFMRPPLYPYLLSLVYRLAPHDTYLTARLVNSILDTAACYVAYRLVLLLWQNRGIAVFSTLFYLVNPLILFFSIRVRVEALFTLLVLCAVYLLVKAVREQSGGLFTLAGAGIFLGLACLCRSNAIFIIAFVPLWYLCANRRRMLAAVKPLVVFGACCGLTILPWTLHNYKAYGEPILITDGFGYNFWISNTDIKAGDLAATTNAEYLTADRRLWILTQAEEDRIAGQSLKARDAHYLNLGLEFVKRDPVAWAKLNVLKFAEFWWPMARIDMQGRKAFATLPFGLLAYFGIFFFLRDFWVDETSREAKLLIVGLIVAATVSGVISWSSVRYRVPLVDIYVVPFGLAWLWRRFVRVEDAAA